MQVPTKATMSQATHSDSYLGMTPEEFLSFVLKRDEQAVAFMLLVCTVLHFWDDLEDRDKPIARSDVDAAMFAALIVLPRNPFYQRHFTELSATLELAILNWHAANELEQRDGIDDKRIAFVVRSHYCNLAIQCARLVGGYAWAREVSVPIRRYWHKEGMDGYLLNLEQQRRQAKELNRVL